MVSRLIVVALATLALFGQASPALRPDPPTKCSACDEWNRPHEPFRLFGNSYYVGVAGLSAILITSNQGHILLDGGLPQSAPLIDANIRRLGFKTADIKLIAISHGHYDHAGGIAALQRVSGATVAASESSARALESGENTPDDPQFGFGRAANEFPAVKNVRAMRDREQLTIGDLTIQAHLIPGHSPGSTAWTWRSCDTSAEATVPKDTSAEATVPREPRCLNMVYADSLSAVSAPGFRFTGDAKTPSRVELFRQSIATLAQLPCDIIVSPHPSFTAIDQKLKARAANPATNPFIDPQGCRAYAANGLKGLEARIVEEMTR